MEKGISRKAIMMEYIYIISVVAVVLLSVGAACFFRYREKRTLQKIDNMLDKAINGDFRENDFDESMLSAVESKLAYYLSASVVSAKNLAEGKNKIKKLIADISHQTKTPLSNILLYTELLAEENSEGDSYVYAAELNVQAKKLQFLISSLIKISRLEAGVLALHPQKAPVFPMLKKATDEFREKASEKDITLDLEHSEEVALFDTKWTEEAVCNLIDNAVKYTPTGGTVSLRVLPYEMFCRIDVIDSGIGIEENIQTKIFGRFYRGEAVCEEEGVGIGLYLVRMIAADQGGYVKVSSRRGEGSVFSLFLPKD